MIPCLKILRERLKPLGNPRDLCLRRRRGDVLNVKILRGTFLGSQIKALFETDDFEVEVEYSESCLRERAEAFLPLLPQGDSVWTPRPGVEVRRIRPDREVFRLVSDGDSSYGNAMRIACRLAQILESRDTLAA